MTVCTAAEEKTNIPQRISGSRWRLVTRSPMAVAASTDQSIPLAPGALPLVGHLLRLRREPLRFLESMPADSGLVRFRIWDKEIVMICDPELGRQMLSDDRTFDKGGPLNPLVQDLVGNGLATCPHAQHRPHRRLIQPVFHNDKLPRYTQTMTAGISMVTNGWQNGQVLDIPVEMRRLAAYATVKTLFSDALVPAAIEQTVDDFTSILIGYAQRLGKPALLNRLPTTANRRHHQAISRVRQLLAGIIEERRRIGNLNRNDLLAALLSTNADGTRVMTDEQIVDNAATFLVAPTAILSSVLGWTFHLLARRPDVQSRLHHEVDALPAGVPLSFEHLPQLGFTRRVIIETLRMYPSVWIMTRAVTVDTRLGNHLLPAGTVVTYSSYLVHHRDGLYDNPERFDPDRWDESRHPAPPRNAFIPFGGGARICIATQYAPTMLAIALATIVSQWRLEPVSGTPLSPRASVNLTARGLRMRAILRAPTASGGGRACPVSYGQQTDQLRGQRSRRPTRRSAWLL
jgi:pentalenene oxygenase